MSMWSMYSRLVTGHKNMTLCAQHVCLLVNKCGHAFTQELIAVFMHGQKNVDGCGAKFCSNRVFVF